jgi:hypothetical protein
MPGLFVTQSVSILPPLQQSAGSIKFLAAQVQAATKGTDQEQLGNLTGQGLANHQSQLDTLYNALRAPLPFPDTIAITDATGNLIAWIGQPPSSNPGLQPAWFQGLDLSGTVTAPIWRFDSTGHLNATDASGAIAIVPGSEIQINDNSGNIAVMQPTGIFLELASLVVAALASTSYLSALNIGGTQASPVITISNGGAMDFAFPSNIFINIDGTGFIKVLDATGNFSQLTPTGVLSQNAAATRSTFINDAGEVGGTSVGGSTFAMTGNSLSISNMPSSNPGAGTKQFWYDPADSDRVKYAP